MLYVTAILCFYILRKNTILISQNLTSHLPLLTLEINIQGQSSLAYGLQSLDLYVDIRPPALKLLSHFKK